VLAIQIFLIGCANATACGLDLITAADALATRLNDLTLFGPVNSPLFDEE